MRRAALPHIVARAGQQAHTTAENQEEEMMNWNEMGSGMGLGMGFGWIFGLLCLALVVLVIAALIKYLRK